MKATVFGCGYVGLVQGLTLAEVGHEVLCVDIDPEKIGLLRQGIVPFYEPGVADLLKGLSAKGAVSFASSVADGVLFGEVLFIAVGTPEGGDGAADMRAVESLTREIGRQLKHAKVVVTKSTVPVGTADKLQSLIDSELAKRSESIKVDVVSNPEFLKEGSALADCRRPNRIIVGSDSAHAIKVMRALYAPFNRNHDKLMVMDVRSAELTKYAANCMLATKISFMNEMANIAERMGADIEAVRKGIGADPRIGYHFIYPGCGFGGSCFPKDVKALIHTSESHAYTPQLLSAVSAVNTRQKQKLAQLIFRRFGTDLVGKTFAIWGLSFKPNTDDMRDAPSRVVIEALLQAGGKVQAYDPVAMQEALRIFGAQSGIVLTENHDAALQGADALVICTEWAQFKAPDFSRIKSLLRTAVIFDGRNLYEPEAMTELGIEYYGIGRGLSVG